MGVWLQTILVPVNWTGEMMFSCPRLRRRLLSFETGSTASCLVSALKGFSQYYIYCYLRDLLFGQKPHAALGQFQVTQLPSVSGVDHREYAGTGRMVLKVA